MSWKNKLNILYCIYSLGYRIDSFSNILQNNDPDKRPTAAIIVNKVIHWLNEINHNDDDDVDELFEYSRVDSFKATKGGYDENRHKALKVVTKDLETETIPQRSSVMRVKVIDTIHLSLNVQVERWNSGTKDVDECIKGFQPKATGYKNMIEWISLN
ncbi:hypothetical protein C2G38_2151056 [Gigaspora rosea]|uniref:Uncharacterized protein n=1 Tax=Gigaspora rosea TaxID=44941 RepID=A0A397W973_9GLOM|nr:hypothetical protein C2G38_2151056 [Gigaspora rosea]